MPYIYQEFPKWQYHPAEPACIVATQDELEALGDGWVSSPADVVPAAAEPEVKKPAKGKK